jgi:hypothetical protein
MDSNIIWEVTICSQTEFHRRYGGKYCLHLQGRRYAKQATNMKQAARLLHDMTSQNSVPSIPAAMRTRNPKFLALPQLPLGKESESICSKHRLSAVWLAGIVRLIHDALSGLDVPSGSNPAIRKA